MGDYLVFVSFALAINTLSSFLSLESFKKRAIIASRDFSGMGEKSINWFNRNLLPVIKRCTIFEMILCVLCISLYKNPPSFYTDWSRFLLYMPQIIYLMFIIFVELLVFSVLCWKSSFKNERPYWIGTIEFIFIFIIFGILDLFLPPIFDIISERAFKNIQSVKSISSLNHKGNDVENWHDIKPY